MKSYDIVIGRTGESLTGKLLDRAFTIRTSLGTRLAPRGNDAPAAGLTLD